MSMNSAIDSHFCLSMPVNTSQTPLLKTEPQPLEVQQMHHMYHKACELYERTVAKVSAVGASIPVSSVHAPPPNNTLPNEDPCYAKAYAAAYQQTIRTIPSSYTDADWKRYMDHYLQYYLKAFAALQTETKLSDDKQDAQPSSTVSCEAQPILTSTTVTATSVDQEAPSAKRARLSPNCNGQSELTPTTPVNAATDPRAVESAANRYVWISNLPAGVRAVDIKERCAEFGRVQTVKIIGSRKTGSAPPSIFAYLVMDSCDAAKQLVTVLNGSEFEANRIKAKLINALPIP